LLFLVFVVLSVYYPTLFADFNSVDDRKMVDSLLNTDVFRFKDIFLPGGSGYYYRPLLWSSFIFDKYVWDLHHSFMHLENILLHALNTLFVYFIAVCTARRYEVNSPYLPLCSALLFALHPVNTEAVNWVSGRTDLLAGFFMLLSLLLLLLALVKNRGLLVLPAAAAFFLSCLAKEVTVLFYPAALCLIVFFDGREPLTARYCLNKAKERFFPFLAFTGAAAAYFLLRGLAYKRGDSGIKLAVEGVAKHSEQAVNVYLVMADKARIILKAFGFYGKKIFVPWPLNFGIVKISNYYVVLGILLVLIGVYLLYRRDLIAGLLLTSMAIIAPAFLVPLGRMAWTPVAERYLYIPSATFAVAIVIIAYGLISKARLEKASLLAVPIFFMAAGYSSAARNIVWQSNLTLFEDTVRKSPDFPSAKNELATALIDAGKTEEGFKLLKENRYPDLKKNREFAALCRVSVLVHEKDFEGARRLLLTNMNEASDYYRDVLKQLIDVDGERLAFTTSKAKQAEIRVEQAELYKKLHAKTGDPLYLYKTGQMYLFMGKNAVARQFFAKAYDAAPENAFYRLAAKKLAEKLQQ
jgi:hypothetical protein